MVIDVVDLNFKTLNFSKRYEGSRYRKGIQLYNRRNAQIDKVETDDERNYSVKASVEGNLDTYRTTLEIKGNTIIESTCTCEDYYGGNLCKHIIATSMEVIEPHYASTIEGRKKLEEKRKEEERKRLEELRKRQEEEKKRREYERKYYSGLNTIELFKRSPIRQIANTLDLEELYERTNEII